MNTIAERHIWRLDADYDTLVFRLKELQADYNIFNTLSTYFIHEDSMVIVEAIAKVTEHDQHALIANGLYSEPDTTYEINEFAKIENLWTPVRIQEPIDREEFYSYVTRQDSSSVINCVHLTAEISEKMYRFDFNFEKNLNTMTVVCDANNCEKTFKVFKNLVSEPMSEETYRKIAFSF